ncbi:MAG: alcohol dehydrogenase catalytic domain-containing protein [Lawsonibacter sp.]|nr:alcohol dehydrogenase catalytic domain-containing protein [Lawsonibacter sp.]
MRAAVVTEPLKVEIKEQPMPAVKDDEVLVEVLYAGICGSDSTLYRGAHPFRKPPIIPGHEISGRIAALGRHVSGYEIGQRVVVNHTIPCDECRYCRAGLPNVCPTKIYAGSDRMMGFFAQYVNVPASTLFLVKDGITDKNAAMAEPLSVAFHVMNRLDTIPAVDPENRSLAIIGSGTIGLLCLLAAQRRGYKKVFCIDVLPHTLKVAEKFGAAATFHSDEEGIVETIKELTDGLGVRSTIITAAVPGVINQACGMTAIYGSMIMLPMSKANLEFCIYDLVAKEQHLIGCRGIHRQDFADAVDMINSGFDFSPMISHEFPLDEAWTAFQYAVDRPKGEDVIKVMVTPDR